MDKYTLLLILNIPFVIFGVLRAIMVYRTQLVSKLNFLFRILIWILMLIALIFAQNIYEYLYSRGLTDSTPLSIADVVLVTGFMFCMFLSFRLYSKIDNLEKQITDLHEKLSIIGTKVD